MSRLRNIAGVTRVSLSSSDKGAQQQPQIDPSQGASADRQRTYCGKGPPPTFDLVVFFENATIRVGSAPGLPGAPSRRHRRRPLPRRPPPGGGRRGRRDDAAERRSRDGAAPVAGATAPTTPRRPLRPRRRHQVTQRNTMHPRRRGAVAAVPRSGSLPCRPSASRSQARRRHRRAGDCSRPGDAQAAEYEKAKVEYEANYATRRRGSARPSPPTTTSARCSCSSRAPRSTTRSTSA